MAWTGARAEENHALLAGALQSGSSGSGSGSSDESDASSDDDKVQLRLYAYTHYDIMKIAFRFWYGNMHVFHCFGSHS